MPTSAFRSNATKYQRTYFEETERARIALAETPYVLSHVTRVAQAARLESGQRILEVGAGLGKFTLPLVDRGYSITANDLSPVLLERLTQASGGRVETLVGDVHTLGDLELEPFDGAIGFFVLHHLLDFDSVFRSLAKTLRPGARMAFCEPVGWNPLYALQILCTPSMRFAGEPSIFAMRPSVILPSMRRAGFIETASTRYGYFPPFLKNRPWGAWIEAALETLPTPFPHSFQLFTARLPE